MAERFEGRTSHGQVVTIIKKAAQAHENALGGLQWSGGAANFALEDGSSPVERIDEATYRVINTGEVVRREEGTVRGAN